MAEIEEKSSSEEMTFFEHIDALRPHLVRSAAALFVIMVVAFMCHDFVIDTLLMGPRSPEFPTNRALAWVGEKINLPDLESPVSEFTMVNTTMAGQLNLHLRVSFWAAIVLVIPYLLFELWVFIRPALTSRERKGANQMVFWVSLCFITGLAFGYYGIAPLTVNFLSGYQASDHITNMIDANSYLSTVMNVSLACGVVFLLPLMVLFLAKMGIVTSAFMRTYRRHSIMVLAVLAAIITPPDVVSMILVLLPLYGLYELSIGLAVRVEKKRAAEEAALK